MARILIIDDDKDVCETLGRILEREGHEAVCVLRAEEGLARVARECFHLVLADIFLPTKSGLEFIQDMKRDHPGVKVIAMATFGATEDVDFQTFAVRYGAVGFLEKPFDRRAVVRLVDQALATG